MGYSFDKLFYYGKCNYVGMNTDNYNLLSAYYGLVTLHVNTHMPTEYLYIPNLLCKFRRKLSLWVILSYSEYFMHFVLILTQGRIFVDF